MKIKATKKANLKVQVGENEIGLGFNYPTTNELIEFQLEEFKSVKNRREQIIKLLDKLFCGFDTPITVEYEDGKSLEIKTMKDIMDAPVSDLMKILQASIEWFAGLLNGEQAKN